MFRNVCSIVYEHNEADKMNNLLLDMLVPTGQLEVGMEATLDFDHEFIPAEKYDALFSDFMPEAGYRLVVQRQEVKPRDGMEDLLGKRYVYRAILTNDKGRSEEEVLRFYNARGASERNFDMQNNDFGWAHLPFSFMKENTVFLLLTAMIKNFYLFGRAAVPPWRGGAKTHIESKASDFYFRYRTSQVGKNSPNVDSQHLYSPNLL